MNAKNHYQKKHKSLWMLANAETVTIATNMFGRGTDIKLGEGVRELRP